jgi:hypothetical protein
MSVSWSSHRCGDSRNGGTATPASGWSPGLLGSAAQRCRLPLPLLFFSPTPSSFLLLHEQWLNGSWMGFMASAVRVPRFDGDLQHPGDSLLLHFFPLPLLFWIATLRGQ